MVIIKRPDCNKYQGAILPPCAALLGNLNPIIKDGKVIFRNLNRLFYFIGSTPFKESRCPNIITNIGISLSTYIIGVFIDQIENQIIPYQKTCQIHSSETINDMIHELIQKPITMQLCYKTLLILAYSNIDAILPPLMYTKNISLNNYLILLAINRLEKNPGLFFVNNSFATEDALNFFLSEIDLSFPQE